MYKYIVDPNRLMRAVLVGRRLKYQRFYVAQEEEVATLHRVRAEEPEVCDPQTVGTLQLTYN